MLHLMNAYLNSPLFDFIFVDHKKLTQTCYIFHYTICPQGAGNFELQFYFEL